MNLSRTFSFLEHSSYVSIFAKFSFKIALMNQDVQLAKCQQIFKVSHDVVWKSFHKSVQFVCNSHAEMDFILHLFIGSRIYLFPCPQFLFWGNVNFIQPSVKSAISWHTWFWPTLFIYLSNSGTVHLPLRMILDSRQLKSSIYIYIIRVYKDFCKYLF